MDVGWRNMDLAAMTIEEISLTAQDIHEQIEMLVGKAGLSVEAANNQLARGELRGTILESKLRSLQFLLEAYDPIAAE